MEIILYFIIILCMESHFVAYVSLVSNTNNHKYMYYTWFYSVANSILKHNIKFEQSHTINK